MTLRQPDENEALGQTPSSPGAFGFHWLKRFTRQAPVTPIEHIHELEGIILQRPGQLRHRPWAKVALRKPYAVEFGAGALPESERAKEVVRLDISSDPKTGTFLINALQDLAGKAIDSPAAHLVGLHKLVGQSGRCRRVDEEAAGQQLADLGKLLSDWPAQVKGGRFRATAMVEEKTGDIIRWITDPNPAIIGGVTASHVLVGSVDNNHNFTIEGVANAQSVKTEPSGASDCRHLVWSMVGLAGKIPLSQRLESSLGDIQQQFRAAADGDYSVYASVQDDKRRSTSGLHRFCPALETAEGTFRTLVANVTGGTLTLRVPEALKQDPILMQFDNRSMSLEKAVSLEPRQAILDREKQGEYAAGLNLKLTVGEGELSPKNLSTSEQDPIRALPLGKTVWGVVQDGKVSDLASLQKYGQAVISLGRKTKDSGLNRMGVAIGLAATAKAITLDATASGMGIDAGTWAQMQQVVNASADKEYVPEELRKLCQKAREKL
jgi:hypothetical protein